MIFNKDTFIVPLNNDIVLKLRNIDGNIVYYITKPNSTIKINNNTLEIIQSQEANKIILKFINVEHAQIAQYLLREALIQLKNNLTNDNFITYG